MRKNPIILQAAAPIALVLYLTASCCHHVNAIDQEDDIPISMSVSSTGSKAIVNDLDGMIGQCFDNENNYKTGTGFGVYGYKKESNVKSIKLFDKYSVYPSERISSPTWLYTPKRYWDSNPNVSYQFIAYWPHLADEVSATAPYVSVPGPDNGDYTDERKVLTIHNVPNWQPVNQDVKDFMTAVRQGRYDAEFSSRYVTFSFYHILSRLVIKAYYVGADKSADGGVLVKGITLKKYGSDKVLNGGSTNFEQSYNQVRAQKVADATTMSDSYQLFTSTEGVGIPYHDEASQSAPVPGEVSSWLFVPFKWKELNIMVSYQVTADGSVQDSDDILVPLITENIDNYNTLPGKSYVVTLIFNTIDSKMKVESVVLQDWTEHNVERELYNL